MGYRALFLAPWTISTARDPRYIVIWKSIKIANVLISERFHWLERTVLAPGTISTAVTPGAQ